MTDTVFLSSPLPPDEVPREFRIFPMGEFTTEKGTFLYNKDSERDVLATWKRRGLELSLDYEHASLRPAGEIATGAPAAGWYDIEARADGLYAVNVRWTPRAEEFLRNHEYRYFSPAFAREGNRVTRLVNIALTNLPATDDQQPLVAAKAIGYAEHPIVDDPWDASAAEGRLRKWASKDGSGDKDQMNWSKYAEGFAYVTGDGTSFGDYHLPHHDVHGGKLVTNKHGVIAAAAAVDGARNAKVPADEVEAVKRHLAQHYHQWGDKAPWETTKTSEDVNPEELKMDETLKAHHDMIEAHGKMLKEHGETLSYLKGHVEQIAHRLGVAAPGAQPTVAEGAMCKEDIAALTGKPDGAEQLGIITRWRDDSVKLSAVEKELTELKGRQLELEVTSLVEGAIKDGKLTPAQKQTFVDQGKKDIAFLKGYLSTAPVIGGAKTEEPKGSQATQGGTVELTELEKHQAEKMGVDPALVLERKKAALSSTTK